MSSLQVLLQPYGVRTTLNLLFVDSCMQFQLKCVGDAIFALSGTRFLFLCVIKFLVSLDLPHSQKCLPDFEIDFYLLYFKEIRLNWCDSLYMKVNLEQLIEAAKFSYDFQSKYNISAFNEQANFLVCLFNCFFSRLQI